MRGRVGKTAGSIGLAAVAAGVGLAIAGVTYLMATVVTTEMTLDVGLSLYGSQLVAALAGGAAAAASWAAATRVLGLRLMPPAAAFTIAALLSAALCAAHLLLTANPLGAFHTWGALYLPWIAVLACASGIAAAAAWVKNVAARRAG